MQYNNCGAVNIINKIQFITSYNIFCYIVWLDFKIRFRSITPAFYRYIACIDNWHLFTLGRSTVGRNSVVD